MKSIIATLLALFLISPLYGKEKREIVVNGPYWYEKFLTPTETPDGFLVSGQSSYNMSEYKVERHMTAVYHALSAYVNHLSVTIKSNEVNHSSITKADGEGRAYEILGEANLDYTLIRQSVDAEGIEFVLLMVTQGKHKFICRQDCKVFKDHSIFELICYFSPFCYHLTEREENKDGVKIYYMSQIGSYERSYEYDSNDSEMHIDKAHLGFDKEVFEKSIEEEKRKLHEKGKNYGSK